MVLEGHKGVVSTLIWPHPSAIYSGSWDHSIKMWDVKTGVCSNTWHGNKVVNALSLSPHINLLASAHNDTFVRVWDPRQKDKEAIKSTLKSHTGWVSDVAWCNSKSFPHLLVSTSYDGTVKLWDVRSMIPLHTMEAHTDKALCVDWHQNQIISGGADNMLHSFAVDSKYC